MDLTRTLLRFGAARPHVLLAELPGGTAERLAIEAELRRRDWPRAVSPAEADILVVAGPGDVSLGTLVNTLWSQIPKPRGFVRVAASSTVRAVLDETHRGLLENADPGEQVVEQNEHGVERDSRQDGMVMADRGPDRDGLRLDQLHVPLGPFLPDWPAGLVVHTTLQGDVIQDAHPAVLGEAHAVPQPGRVVLVDSLARLLSVAGWDDAAARARLVRDGMLGTATVTGLSAELYRLTRRVRRARTLRWLTDGLGGVTTRWLAWLDEIERLEQQTGDTTAPRRPNPGAVLDGLPELLRGVELASARLIVASFDPELKALHTRGPTGVPDA